MTIFVKNFDIQLAIFRRVSQTCRYCSTFPVYRNHQQSGQIGVKIDPDGDQNVLKSGLKNSPRFAPFGVSLAQFGPESVLRAFVYLLYWLSMRRCPWGSE